MKRIALFAACILLTFHQNFIVAGEPKWALRLDPLVKPYVDRSIVVGLTVGAIRGNQSVVRGYGRLRPNEPGRPDGETLYEIGSITKTFSGLLLADAVVRGRVQLDQRVADLLPKEVQMPQHSGGPIRLVHLATHASGLPRLPSNFAPEDALDPYADYTTKDLWEFLQKHSLRHAPAEKYAYSNVAFGLLGQLLANQADDSYSELLRTAITGPLEMNNTGILLSNSMRRSLAPPHDADLVAEKNWHFSAMAGAGAIRSTVTDMLRYAQAHLDPPDGPLGDAIELAWKVHQPPVNESDLAMGLGWHVARDGVTRWHNGQTGGYHSMLLINRKRDTAVVVLANTATGEVDTLAEQLMRAISGSEERPRAFPAMIDVPAADLEKLVGRYALSPIFVLTVKIEDGKLLVGATGQSFHRVYPRSASEWDYRVVDASLSFKFDEAGKKATAVVLHQNGLHQRAIRLTDENENREKPGSGEKSGR